MQGHGNPIHGEPRLCKWALAELHPTSPMYVLLRVPGFPSVSRGKTMQIAGRDRGCVCINRYNANPIGHHTTIFLFPGGMGSRLMRADRPYQDGPPFVYDTV